MTDKLLPLAAAASLTGLAVFMPAAAPAAQDEASASAAAEGAAVFGTSCKGCHAAEPDQPSFGGPNLAGVVGRPAASAQFGYSAALRNSGLTWTPEELDAYLASPMAKVPGTSMVISLRDAGQRRAVIAFLGTAASE